MTLDEIQNCQRLLVGHWPTPQLTEEEQAVWMRTLGPLSFGIATKVIDALSRTGRVWRPTDGEFIDAFKQELARPKEFPVLPAEAPLPSDESARRWRALAEWQRADKTTRGPAPTIDEEEF